MRCAIYVAAKPAASVVRIPHACVDDIDTRIQQRLSVGFPLCKLRGVVSIQTFFGA